MILQREDAAPRYPNADQAIGELPMLDRDAGFFHQLFPGPGRERPEAEGGDGGSAEGDPDSVHFVMVGVVTHSGRAALTCPGREYLHRYHSAIARLQDEGAIAAANPGNRQGWRPDRDILSEEGHLRGHQSRPGAGRRV